ncbi:MAG: hypothetical protein ACYSSI_00945, partial [Planctomycetota bacterium]
MDTWRESVKSIRAMAKRCKKKNIEYSRETPAPENTTEVPPDNELFAAPVPEDLSAEQVFAGDKDF